MFATYYRNYKLLKIGRIHTLLVVLSSPKIVCFGNIFRDSDRLFLDMPNKTQKLIRSIVSDAQNIGLVNTKIYRHVSRPTTGVSLSSLGVRVANIFIKKGNKR